VKTTWRLLAPLMPFQFQMASVVLEAQDPTPPKRRTPVKPSRSMTELALRVRRPTFSLKIPLTARVPPPRLMAALSLSVLPFYQSCTGSFFQS